MTSAPCTLCGALSPALMIKEKRMSKYGYSSSPPRTRAGSYVEDAYGKSMLALIGSTPLLILATGNPAGLLALPMLALIPLAFTKTRRTSDQEYKETSKAPTKKVTTTPKSKNNLSPTDQELADKFLKGMGL